MYKILTTTLMLIFSMNSSASEKDIAEGACYATLSSMYQKKIKIGSSVLPLLKLHSGRAANVLDQAGTCADPQGRYQQQCLKNKLSSADYDFFVGINRSLKVLNSPQDPGQLAHHDVLNAQYCAPLVSGSGK
jgi:hypothetical protein